MKVFIFIFSILFNSSTILIAQNLSKAYFAGGCFWCMEESFENLIGVKEVISGYSGGITANPTYREVTYGDTGHFEVVEIIYDKEKISYEELLNNFWINIDPFDAYGQFCDKGYSYRSVTFYKSENQKELIEENVKKLEKKFKKKVVTYIKKFEIFYKAENKHQDYYEVYFQNYLKYKKACRREKILNNIWGS